MRYTAAFLCAGMGGGARGFLDARAEWKGIAGHFEIVGAVDVDPAACEAFELVTGHPCAQADLMDREQYRAFHGHEPPADWHQVTPADFREWFGDDAPDVIFISAPCKGFSALLPSDKAASGKYQALNRLAERCIWLTLEAWGDKGPRAILFENVPRIRQRGKDLLQTLEAMLNAYGYAWRSYDHDAGEIGGLAQHRTRFLGIARHIARCRPIIYQPERQRLKSVGEVLSSLPMPDDPAAGPMHRLPRLQLLTWIRLALIPAGKDWRALQQVERVEFYQHQAPGYDGQTLRANGYRVQAWNDPAYTVTGARDPIAGGPVVADPRLEHEPRRGVYAVVPWSETSGAVTGAEGVGRSNSITAVADPRLSTLDGRFKGKYRVIAWNEAGTTISAGISLGSNAAVVADPRIGMDSPKFNHAYRVGQWTEPGGTVASGTSPSSGASIVADPRLGCAPRAGGYGVLDWEQTAGTVAASADVHAGCAAVADPRWAMTDRPEPPPVIIAEDGTWHRPLTTLELLVLQGFDPRRSDGSYLVLPGRSDARWREHIGNAVPPPTARAIAEQILITLLMDDAGTTFRLSTAAPWVSPNEVGQVAMFGG